MVRFIGVDLPRDKKVAYALAYIHGIGIKTGKQIVKLANISSEIRTNDLTTEQTICLEERSRLVFSVLLFLVRKCGSC